MKIIIKEINDCSECPYKHTSHGQGFDNEGCSLANCWIIGNKPVDTQCPLPDSKDYIITKNKHHGE